MTRLALFLAVLACPAAAREARDCTSAVTQMEMNQCAQLDWEEADQHLNAIYKEAIALTRQWDGDLAAGERGAEQSLREAQRAWIAFRDLACETEGFAMKGGSAELLLVYGCMARLTRVRTGDLGQMVESFGGF